MNLHQGDQLVIKVRITCGGSVVTPENCLGVKIKMGSIQHEYPDGELSFDAESSKWMFPVTQSQTLAMGWSIDTQVQVNFGGTPPTIVSSGKHVCPVDVTIIKELW